MGVWGIDEIRQTIQEVIEPINVNQTQANQTSVNNLKPDSRVGEARMNSSMRRFQIQNAQTTPTVQPRQQPSVDMDKVKQVFNTTIDGSSLAIRTSDKFTYLNSAEKTELIAMAVRSDRAEQLLTSFMPASPPNVTYDQQRQLATAIGQAYKEGKINDADLRQVAQRLESSDFGTGASARFVETLAQAPQNVQVGGVVEAYGRQAKSLGQDQAAALAFSSSEALIQNNLPNYEDKQAAYAQVKSFLESDPQNRVTQTGYGAIPVLQSAYVQALGNFARLHSWGMGTDTEVDSLLEKAGPRFVQEAIARSSHVVGDNGFYSALKMFGDASERMAAKTDGDKQRDWYVNAAMSYTQSPELINTNLSTPAQRIAAFDLLNHELAGSRDAARDAASGDYNQYTLLRSPAQAQGLANLLTEHPDEIINAKLGANGDNAQGQADLVNLLQSTVFSPYTSQTTRTQVQNAIQSYIGREVNKAGNDSSHIGYRLGGLLGVLQVASQKAVDDAKKPEEKTFAEQVATEFAKTVLKAGADAALSETGPVGTLVGGFVFDQALNQIFDGKPPSPDELGNAYINKLKGQGVNISLGEELRKRYEDLLNDVEKALRQQYSEAKSQQSKSDINAAINQVISLRTGIGINYDHTINSYQFDTEQLHQALNNWSDGYKYSKF